MSIGEVLKTNLMGASSNSTRLINVRAIVKSAFQTAERGIRKAANQVAQLGLCCIPKPMSHEEMESEVGKNSLLMQALNENLPDTWATIYGIARKTSGSNHVVTLQKRPVEGSAPERMQKGFLWFVTEGATKFEMSMSLQLGATQRMVFNDASTRKAYYVKTCFKDLYQVVVSQGEIVDGIKEVPRGEDVPILKPNPNKLESVPLDVSASIDDGNLYLNIGNFKVNGLGRANKMNQLNNVIANLDQALPNPDGKSDITDGIAIEDFDFHEYSGQVVCYGYSQVDNENPTGGAHIVLRGAGEKSLH